MSGEERLVVHHREARAIDREDFDQFLEALLDPPLAVLEPLAAEEGPAHAPSDAVIPGGDRRIDVP